MFNKTITQLTPTQERLPRTLTLAAFRAPFTKDKAILKIERLIKCRCSKKRFSEPELDLFDWVLGAMNATEDAVLKVRAIELMDYLVADIFQFLVDTVPGVTRPTNSLLR